MSQGSGFFGWIREGVRQSVLQGMSDAMDTIGTPETNKELHPALLSFARNVESPLVAQRTDTTTAKRLPGTTSSGRKRLGKSLRDIEPSKPTP